MKYFVLGSLSSGLLLFGMSLLYGATGTLDLAALRAAVEGSGETSLLLTGTVFMIAGIAFKFGAAPFHMWVPDTYHGAPTPITLFIGTAPDRKSVVSGKSVSVRVDLGGRRIIKKKKTRNNTNETTIKTKNAS